MSSIEKPYAKYIGEKFGKLKILEFKPGEYKKGKVIRAKANCECDCGSVKLIDWDHLKRGAINSCGCLRDPSVFIGQQFGNLTILEIIPHNYKNGKRILTKAKCECVCGIIKTVNVNNLQAGNTISCGCIGIKNIIKAATKHGLSNNNYIYNTWANINKRCYNKNLKAYKNYGERGIVNFWRIDPDGFVKYILQELGPKPSKKHSLDRINNDGNYEPGNLRWATYKQQANNKTHAHQRRIEALEARIKFLEDLYESKKAE